MIQEARHIARLRRHARGTPQVKLAQALFFDQLGLYWPVGDPINARERFIAERMFRGPATLKERSKLTTELLLVKLLHRVEFDKTLDAYNKDPVLFNLW